MKVVPYSNIEIKETVYGWAWSIRTDHFHIYGLRLNENGRARLSLLLDPRVIEHESVTETA